MTVKYKYSVMGLIGGGVILLALGALVVVVVAANYDGKCGGLIPFLSGPRECTFLEYITSEVPFTFAVLFYCYWYIFPLLLLTPTCAGFVVDCLRKSRVL